jgi:hypothetical protein
MLPDETIANLVQRMQTLKFALAVQEQTAVFKLIQAIRPASLSEEVRRQLYATGTESKDWTVTLVGQVAVRLDRAHSQEALWSVSIQHMDAPRAMARMSAPRQPSADHGGRTTESRSCQNCGKPGHIARFCRSQPTPAKPPVVRGHTAKAEPTARTDRVCYHCNQPGHFANQCAKKRADLQQASGGKMWCTHHKVDSHDTADCKVLQSRAQPAQRTAAARSAQTAAPRTEHKGPQPTMAELQELWDAHYDSMQGLCAKVIPTSVSRFSGHYNTLPGGHAAPLHSGLTAPAKKNERLRGPQTDMPLGFLPKDFLAVPVRPPPGTLAAPSNSTKEPVAKATPVMTAPAPPMVVEVTPLPEVPATLPPVDTRDLPAGFEELPLDTPTHQGMIYGPSVKETQVPPNTEVEPAPGAVAPIPAEDIAPLATSVVTRETRTNFGNLYDAQNPQLAAMLSKLPENYHSDRTVGFHRSPRIDNSGPSPKMLINGRVVTNLLLDCGAKAIITGQPGAAAMGITPAMIQRNAIVIRTATGKLVRLD